MPACHTIQNMKSVSGTTTLQRVTSIVSAIALIAVVVPFIWLGSYAHPQCDDWWFAVMVQNHGVLGAQAEWYSTWLGRYTSNFLNSLAGSAPFLLSGYGLIPGALLVALFGAIWFALCRAFQGQVPRRHLAFAAAAFVLIWATTQYSTREGIYWFSASLTYQSGAVLGFLLLGYLVGKGKYRVPGCTIAAVVSFLAVGCSEIATAWILPVLLVGAFLQRKEPTRRWGWFSALGGATAGTSLLLLAPASNIRSKFNPDKHDVAFTIETASDQLFETLPRWLLAYAVVGASLVIALYVWRNRDALTLAIPTPRRLALAAAALLVMTLLLHTANPWALGWASPWRVREHIHLVFLAGWFSIWFFVCVCFVRTTRFRNLEERLTRLRPYLTVGSWLVFVAGAWLGEGTRWVLSDLPQRAPAFDGQMKMRYEQIHQARRAGLSELEVDWVADPPVTLLYFDITADPAERYNQLMAEYFGLDRVWTDER